MTDDGFEDFLRTQARGLNHPPATPREEMWSRIVAERRSRGQRYGVHWTRWVTAAAALLALGIGVGWYGARFRSFSPIIPTGPVAAQLNGAADGAYDVAATQYLGRTEALITAFVVDARHGTREHQVASTARDLLTTNRLLQDSPAANDPQMKVLLQDLELVLAQIAQLSAQHGQSEVNLIVQGLNQSGVMVRLRTAIPAGPAARAPQETSDE
jgi:hypothetical protein